MFSALRINADHQAYPDNFFSLVSYFEGKGVGEVVRQMILYYICIWF